MLGKHFLIRSLDQDKTARQYTICNVMRPEIYEELLRLLRVEDVHRTKLFNFMHTQDQNNMMFAIKDYASPTGVSHKLHTRSDVEFSVKGPMGRRLEVKKTGVYYCFAAGTGVLPFMDLIAQLAFANLNVLDKIG
jgi:predicted ferric reductase